MEVDGVESEESSVPEKPKVAKVISINGEEVEASNIDNINIHDFAEFEKEEVMTRKFFSTIRRKTYPADGSTSGPGGRQLKKQLSFHEVVKTVVLAESVLAALKHYSHRSDSESELETEEEDVFMDESPYRKKKHSQDVNQNQEKEGSATSSLPTDNQQSTAQTNNNEVVKSTVPVVGQSPTSPSSTTADHQGEVDSLHDITVSMPNGKEAKTEPSLERSGSAKSSTSRRAFLSKCPCSCVLV